MGTTEGCADKKVVWSKQNGEGKMYKIEQNRIDFVDKLKWEWGV